LGRKTGLLITDTLRTDLYSMIDAAHREKDIGLYQRCKAILLLGEEKYSQSAVSVICDSPTRTIRTWVKRFRESGVSGLREKPKPGAKPRLNSSQQYALRMIILGTPEKYGLETGIWTALLVRTVIKREFGVTYDVSHVRRILHDLGFSVQFPRESLSKADLNKQLQWLHTTFPEIKKKPKKKEGRCFLRTK